MEKWGRGQRNYEIKNLPHRGSSLQVVASSRKAIVRRRILVNLKRKAEAFTRHLLRPTTGISRLGRSVNQTCIILLYVDEQ